MHKKKTITLLPSGMADILPPNANNIYSINLSILRTMKSWGYQVVNPPLIEYEASLFANAGKYWKNQAFRLTDPLSQGTNQEIDTELNNSSNHSSIESSANNSIAIRCDMTTQVARIACERLNHIQRPLRLCYSGKIFRTFSRNGENLRERHQIGAELYSSPSLEADIECLELAIECLNVIKIPSPHISISYPSLMKNWISSFSSDSNFINEVLGALNLQNNKFLLKIRESTTVDLKICIDGLLEWIEVTALNRTFDVRLKSYLSTKIGIKYNKLLHRLSLLLSDTTKHHSGVSWHIDLADIQGFDYQDGFCFSLFSSKSKVELGRGGRYIWKKQDAVGFSFYIENLELISTVKVVKNLYLPYRCRHIAKDLRQQGYSVVVALEIEEGDIRTIANQLNCTFIWCKHLGLINTDEKEGNK